MKDGLIKIPMILNARELIRLQEIPKAHDFQCPHCEEKPDDVLNRFHDGVTQYTGPIEQRHDDAGFDWAEVLKCPITGKLYWYLNGV